MEISYYKKYVLTTGIIAVMLIGINIVNAQATYDCSNPHPDWVFCDDFERSLLRDVTNGYSWSYNFNYSGDAGVSDYFPTCSATQACADIVNTYSHSGYRSMRAWYPANDTGAMARAHLGFTDANIPWLDTIYVRYYRMFPNGWIYNPDRPMHTISIHAGQVSQDGMSTDLTVYEDNNDSTHKSNLVAKSVYQSGLIVPEGKIYVSGTYPVIPFNVASPVPFVNGVWYEIQFMVKMNTPGQQDGQFKLWINGLLVTDQQNLFLRDNNHSNLKFRHLFFAPNYPPAGPTQAQSNYIDDVVISKSYIPSMGSITDITNPSPPTNLH
jgi:hypothetical protein